LRLLALRPHPAEALAAHDDHVRAGPVRMRLLVGTYGKLRDVAVHRSLGHAEANVAAARAAFIGGNERKVDRIGNEVCVEEQTFLLSFVCKVIRFAAEALAKIVLGPKDEIDIAI